MFSRAELRLTLVHHCLSQWNATKMNRQKMDLGQVIGGDTQAAAELAFAD